jgi:hypothetical protein
MTKAIFAGADDHDLIDALEAEGVTVTTIDGLANRPALEEAGIHDAALFVVTEREQATAIPIARDLVDELQIVAYTGESLPDFVSGQELLAVDPELLGPAAVAEELTS